MDGLDRRVERLERELGRWRVGVLIGVVLALGVLVSGAASPPGPKQSTRFELVDESGQIRGLWTATNTGAGLLLMGTSGRPSVLLTEQREFSGITVVDVNNVPLATLAGTMAGDASVQLLDSNKVARLGMINNPPGIVLRDPNGKERVAVGAVPGIGTGLAVYTREGSPRYLFAGE